MSVTSDAVDDILKHYGVKGMKWGRRSAPPPAGTVRVTDKGKKLKTEGGKGFPTHPDATNAAVAKQKAKASGVKSLSNKELQDLSTRLNLEQSVKRLSVQDRADNANPAARFVKRLLVNSGKQEAQKASNEVAAQGVAKLLKKR